MIRKGNTCAEAARSRFGTEWEDFHGIAACDDYEGVWLASYYMCERCADLYFSFQELGFECVTPDENMLELAKEYHAIYVSRRIEG